ncbi:MAG: molybdenum cofactor guanylyltransferase [Dethiobacter sp.]|nr:molybdenum cofactor guanylyltransferase [Dethiobacter sp.]MCL5981656.1 molybdenum cofactor guanylyltransferase [Bacillota bacterium]
MKTTEMSAVVLAGGRSSRMGENKLLLPLGDSTVIGTLLATLTGLFAECVLVTDHPDAYRDWPVHITADLISGPQKNSLTGIHAGLSVSTSSYNLLVAGDMPFVVPELLCRLAALSGGYDVVVPQQGAHYQPLCAVYHKNCLPHITALLARNQYKILDFFSAVRVRRVDVAELVPYDRQLLSFLNVNTPEDYRLAQDLVGQFRSGRLK